MAHSSDGINNKIGEPLMSLGDVLKDFNSGSACQSERAINRRISAIRSVLEDASNQMAALSGLIQTLSIAVDRLDGQIAMYFAKDLLRSTGDFYE